MKMWLAALLAALVRRRRRYRAASTIFVLAGLLALTGCAEARADGPIALSDEVEIGLPSLGATPVTFGLPLSPGSGPITLESAELIEVSGLEIVAVKACEGSPWTSDSYLNCAPTGGPWPPANVVLREVAGTVIGNGPAAAGGLLVGAKLEAGAQSGEARGVRIFYAYSGVEYQVDEPWTLRITTP